MAEAILIGARVGTGTTVSVDGTATLIGHKLCVSNRIVKVYRKRVVRNWRIVSVPSTPLIGVVSLLEARGPPVVSTVNPIAIPLMTSVGGDLCFGGELWP